MEVYRNYESDVQSRIAGAKNTRAMLAMAAPLEFAPSSSQKSKLISVPEVKKADIKDQKAGLLEGLLAVGALRPAIALLSKFPWLGTEIADLLICVLKVSLSPLYDSLLITKERNPSFTHPKARYGLSGISYPSPPQTHSNTLGAKAARHTHHRFRFLLLGLRGSNSNQYFSRRPSERR
jgi:THO complex subunit 2